MILRFSALMAASLITSAATASDPCPADRSDVEWAATCFQNDQSARRVKPPYLNLLKFDRRGYTTVVISEPRELVAVDRNGKVVVPGIMHTGDYDYPHAYAGIARFTKGSQAPGVKARPQCGYFDSRDFRIVIPAQYDHCEAFADGEAVACRDCESYCTEPDCHNRILVGGTGFILGLDGTVRGQRKLPDAKSACREIQRGGADSPHHTGTPPRCLISAENPFSELR